MYKNLIKPILFNFDPEDVHNVFTRFGTLLGRYSLTRRLVSSLYGSSNDKASVVVDGIRYRVPVLLSAGFDYNAELTQILPSIGFGGVEVGSVTARPCEGNAKPRLTRLPNSKSILVNKGLRNDGADAIIKRLQKTPRVEGFVIGVSIARTNDREASSVDGGIEDYATTFRKLNEANVGDYYTLNISCPNAFGGEAFTDPVLLQKLLFAIDAIPCNKPVYVKMPINLSWDNFAALLDEVSVHRIRGVIIGNLNKDYNFLDVRSEAPKTFCGGLSGKPCFELSNSLIEKTKKQYGNRFTIIGCGGVMSVEDARTKINSGASLIQLITGMIYEGPSLISKIAHGL